MVVSLAGSKAMIRISLGQGQGQNAHAYPLLIVYTSCMLDQYSTIFGVVTLYVDVLFLP